MKHLIIPQKKKGVGEYIFCRKCNRNVSTKCFENGKKIYTCKYPERQNYKASYFVPDSGNERIVKLFETRDYNTFKKEKLLFFEKLQKMGLNAQNVHAIRQMLKAEKEGRPTKLEKVPEEPEALEIELVEEQATNVEKPMNYKRVCQLFLDYMQDIGVPDYEKKNYSKKYVEEIANYLNHFATVLQRLHRIAATFPINKIGVAEVSALHHYYENEKNHKGEKKFGNHAYNKGMLVMKKLFRYLVNELDYALKNPFEKVKEKSTTPKEVDSVSLAEFEQLLEVITPENGWAIKHDRNRSYKMNHYQPWLKQAYRLAIETGERRDGLAFMRWSNINMKTSIIRILNHKLSNMEKQEIIRKIPITKSLKKLLLEMGYEKFKATDQYLIAPEQANRKTIMDKISKSFNHFIQKAGIERELSFRHLRKTYATLMYKYFGESAGQITGQSIDNIIKNYLNKEVIMLQAKNLTLEKMETKVNNLKIA